MSCTSSLRQAGVIRAKAVIPSGLICAARDLVCASHGGFDLISSLRWNDGTTYVSAVSGALRR